MNSLRANISEGTCVCVPCPQQKLLMCVPGSQQLPSPGDFTDFPTRGIASPRNLDNKSWDLSAPSTSSHLTRLSKILLDTVLRAPFTEVAYFQRLTLKAVIFFMCCHWFFLIICVKALKSQILKFLQSFLVGHWGSLWISSQIKLCSVNSGETHLCVYFPRPLMHIWTWNQIMKKC